MRSWFLILLVVYSGHTDFGQVERSSDPAAWKFSANANLNFIPHNFIFLPIVRADKNNLHLEARYNYEDINTLSAWAGHHFSGGKKIEYTITPMIGAVVGNSTGIAPGIELMFSKDKIGIYSESEYIFNTEKPENNFFYTWTDITYSLTDWLWAGASVQRTRLYKTHLDAQRGILVRGKLKNFEISTYLYNLGFDTPFGIVSISVNF